MLSAVACPVPLMFRVRVIERRRGSMLRPWSAAGAWVAPAGEIRAAKRLRRSVPDFTADDDRWPLSGGSRVQYVRPAGRFSVPPHATASPGCDADGSQCASTIDEVGVALLPYVVSRQPMTGNGHGGQAPRRDQERTTRDIIAPVRSSSPCTAGSTLGHYSPEDKFAASKADRS
jgi:hypothetical protein